MRKEAGVSLAAAAIASTLIMTVFLVTIFAAAATAQEVKEEVVSEEELIPEERAGITPDSPLYIFDKVVDDVQLALAKGEDKTKKALEIKEERLAEASVMVDKKKPDQAKSALELATKAAEQAQKDLSPDLEKETNENVRRAAKLLSGLEEKLSAEKWEEAKKAFDTQLNEEEKVRVALLVSKSRLAYCDSIAREDFDLMKSDELCQIDKAPEWLRGKVESEFKAREDTARKQILDTVGTCIVDPKKCDCSQIPVGRHSQDCEVKKALAIRCEYENDNDACSKLASEKVEDFLPEFVGKEGKETILAALRSKEEVMFEKFKPPECKDAKTFQDCFKVMKELYGEPPECEGLSDDQCAELMKSKGPGEGDRMKDFPPECKEAGVKTPTDCGEIMFQKYGKPPQCEGLDTKECMKLLRHERPDAANFAMPPECQEAGAKEPRQCFDIMTAKFGTPPECAGLDSDACFKEMMKRGPGGAGGEMVGQEPPECKEKGLKGMECFKHMCGDKSPQECFEGKGMGGLQIGERPIAHSAFGGIVPPNCVGVSPEECKAKLREFNELPPECAQNPDKCAEAFAGRGVPEGVPAECAGLEKGQCELVMMKKFGPPECKDTSSREECEKIMKEKYSQGAQGVPEGQSGEFGQFGGFGEGGQGSFGNECEGLAREECEQKMFERFAPPECQGTTKDECRKKMKEKYEQAGQAERHNEGEHREGGGVPFTGEFPREGDAGKGIPPSGFPTDRQGPGPRRIERAPLGEPIRGEPQQSQPTSGGGSEAYPGGNYQRSYEKSSSGDGSYPKPEGEYPKNYPQTSGSYPANEYPQQPSSSGNYPSPSGSYPSGDYPQHSEQAQPQPSSGGSYPSSSSSSSSYPSSGSGISDGGSSSGGSYSRESGTSGGGGGDSSSGTAATITGQIVKALKWIGGR